MYIDILLKYYKTIIKISSLSLLGRERHEKEDDEFTSPCRNVAPGPRRRDRAQQNPRDEGSCGGTTSLGQGFVLFRCIASIYLLKNRIFIVSILSFVNHFNWYKKSQELDDATVRRFLRARNLDVEKGSLMLIKHLQWRKEFVPKGYFSAEEVVRSGLCNNESFSQGRDKIGRPIVVVLAGRHKPITNVDDFKRTRVIYMS